MRTIYTLSHDEVRDACALYIVDAIGHGREVAVDLTFKQRRVVVGDDELTVNAVVHIVGELEDEPRVEPIGFGRKDEDKK